MIENLPELFLRTSRWSSREALRGVGGYRSRRFTYGDLHGLVAGFAGALQAAGAQPGDRLILWAVNCPEWAAAFWSCQFLGMPVVPVDPGFSADFVGRIQAQTGARYLLHDRPSSPGICPAELRLRELSLPPGTGLPRPGAKPDDIAEIVFTSGTTRVPRGVVLRHRQLCAGLNALAPEFDRYRPWARPFQPIRILTLLPLGHLFGQSLALFVPILLGGGAVLVESVPPPWEVVELIRRERVSVLVAVPKLLHQLREHLEGSTSLDPRVEVNLGGLRGAAVRWYRYRNLHRAFGWKFWAIVVGGATLPRREEDFWHRVGILLIQGYGLTEASPIVTLNHPLSIGRGSLGKVIRGQEVKLAPDGEILVRGPGVSTEYLGGSRDVAEGWLKTGDLGRFGTDGRLYFCGRKQEVIVTAEGLNVFPEEVEASLEDQPQIKHACVVGREGDQGEQVHAVLIPRDSQADLEAAIRNANAALEPHQRIRSWSLWPEPDFPRTSGTWKVRRLEVRATLEGRAERSAEPAADDTLKKLVDQLTGRAEATLPNHKLEDLGISSLDRVELLARLEENLQRPLDEVEFSALRSVDEIREWLGQQRSASGPGKVGPPMPRWPRRLPFRLVRDAFQAIVTALVRHYLAPVVTGTEQLGDPDSPVIFAANHTSHLDTPVFLACLPPRWRRRVAPAVRLEFFAGRFLPGQTGWLTRLQDRFLYFLACLLFQVVPLPQSSAGVGTAIRFCGELVARLQSVLIFPEGERVTGTRLGAFRPGAVLLARKLGVPLVPVFLQGVGEVLPPGRHWPRAAQVRVFVGPRYRVPSEPPLAEAAAQFERCYRRWAESLAEGGNSPTFESV